MGVVAALRALLIPGEAAVLLNQPLEWPVRRNALEVSRDAARDVAHAAI